MAKKRRNRDYRIRLAFSGAILVGLILLAGDDRVADGFAQLSLIAVIIGTLLHITGSIVVPAVVSKRSLRTPAGSQQKTIQFGLLDLVLINFAIRFYTMVLPSASAAGVRWLKYQRDGGKADAAALVVLEKVVQIWVYSLFTVLIAAAEASAVGPRITFVVVTTGIATAGSGFALAAFFTDRLDPFLTRLEWVCNLPKIGDKARRLAAAVVSYRGHSYREVAILIGWSAVGYVFFVLSAWVIVVDMGVGLSFLGLAWIRGIVFLATSLPLTVAGIGVREAGFVAFSSLYGVDRPTALAFALSLLLLQVIIGTIGALVELFGLTSRSTPEPQEALDG